MFASLIRWCATRRGKLYAASVGANASITVMLAVALAFQAAPRSQASPLSQCSCQEYCANECPPPEDSEVTDCEITGAADPCLYGGNGCAGGENYYNGCCFLYGTPIVLDLSGDGFAMTSLPEGVAFRIGPQDFYHQVSWTRAVNPAVAKVPTTPVARRVRHRAASGPAAVTTRPHARTC